MSSWAIALGVPCAICIAAVWMLGRSRWAARLADHPNPRSLHSRPTPRIGGIAIVLGSIPVAVAFATPELRLLWSLALGLALVSFADDLRSLPIGIRLAAHFAAAAIAMAAIIPEALEARLALVLLATVCVAWMTNLYNFMDGADGLAGGMAAIGFGVYAIAAYESGAIPLALGCAAVASAAIGFLLFNFPPARVFMGDAGSIPLGFLAGALGVAGAVEGAWPAWFPVLVFSAFAVDATVTLLRRVLRHERVWIAHRLHGYQRLVLSGWSAPRLAAWSYVLMAAAGACALAGRTQGATIQCAILAAWGVFYVVAFAAIERRRPRDKRLLEKTRIPGDG